MENRSKLRILYLYQYLVQNTTSEQPASTVELTILSVHTHSFGMETSIISMVFATTETHCVHFA